MKGTVCFGLSMFHSVLPTHLLPSRFSVQSMTTMAGQGSDQLVGLSLTATAKGASTNADDQFDHNHCCCRTALQLSRVQYARTGIMVWADGSNIDDWHSPGSLNA